MEKVDRIFKKIISIGLVLLIILSTLISSYAVTGEHFSSALTVKQAEDIMVDFGYPRDLCDVMDDGDKLELALQIQNNPESVQLNVISVPIDELSLIELIVNSTDEELLKEGMTEEDIKVNKQNLHQIGLMTDKELMEKYQRNEEEIKLLRMATEKKDGYQKPKKVEDKNKVTTSNISTTTMSYAQTVSDNKASTRKAVSYAVKITFKWSRSPAITFLKDKIAVSWGCDLNSMSEKGTIKFTGNGGSTRNADVEVLANRGLIFSFWQRAVHGFGWDLLSSGTINFTVFQNSKRNLSAALISQYGHGIATITGAGVSIGKDGAGVGIDFAFGFDTSNQLRNNLNV